MKYTAPVIIIAIVIIAAIFLLYFNFNKSEPEPELMNFKDLEWEYISGRLDEGTHQCKDTITEIWKNDTTQMTYFNFTSGFGAGLDYDLKYGLFGSQHWDLTDDFSPGDVVIISMTLDDYGFYATPVEHSH